jgi:hypothetical protein
MYIFYYSVFMYNQIIKLRLLCQYHSCVHVYCTTATECQPNCSYQLYHTINRYDQPEKQTFPNLKIMALIPTNRVYLMTLLLSDVIYRL